MPRSLSPSYVSVLPQLAAVCLCACSPSGVLTASSSVSSSSSSSGLALSMPLTTGTETPAAPAPSAGALPPAQAPVRIVHVSQLRDNYAYVERARAMSNAFGDAPPDYGYDYGPTQVWAWRGRNDSVRLVEPIEGGERFYYYQPGTDEPYLVRDANYSYGYNADGDLVVVYDRNGRPLPLDQEDDYTDAGARERQRARGIYAASLNSERRQVIAANWAARRAHIDAARANWDAQQSREAEWRAYHDEHAAEQAAYWQGERDRRAQEAQAFDDWQHRDYQGAPPPTIGNHRGTAIAATAVVSGLAGGLIAHSDDDQRQRHDQQASQDAQRQQQTLAQQGRGPQQALALRSHDDQVAQAHLDQNRSDLQAQQRLAEQHQNQNNAHAARLAQQQAVLHAGPKQPGLAGHSQVSQQAQRQYDAQIARQQAEQNRQHQLDQKQLETANHQAVQESDIRSRRRQSQAVERQQAGERAQAAAISAQADQQKAREQADVRARQQQAQSAAGAQAQRHAQQQAAMNTQAHQERLAQQQNSLRAHQEQTQWAARELAQQHAQQQATIEAQARQQNTAQQQAQQHRAAIAQQQLAKTAPHAPPQNHAAAQTLRGPAASGLANTEHHPHGSEGQQNEKHDRG